MEGLKERSFKDQHEHVMKSLPGVLSDTRWRCRVGADASKGWLPEYRVITYKEKLSPRQAEAVTADLFQHYPGQGAPLLVTSSTAFWLAEIPNAADRELAELSTSEVWVATYDSGD
jgi:hypothetical protein